MHGAEEAYGNLVAAARAEQGISPSEQKILNAYVLRLGLDPARARELQVLAEAENPPRLRIPKDTKGRLDTLRAVLEVVAADGSIAPKELAVAKALAERLSIRGRAFDDLVKAALRKRLDRAFADLKVEGIEGPELEELRAVPPPPRQALRTMPFVARLAPATRFCSGCRESFADRDAYAATCRCCRLERGIKDFTGGWCETVVGLLFVLFLIPVGILVEHWTGLWSWGFASMRWDEGYRTTGWRRRRGPSVWYLFPAAGLTLIPAWLAACVVSSLLRSLLRRRR